MRLDIVHVVAEAAFAENILGMFFQLVSRPSAA
jgi:hypothetical protein